jgi:hypothetical protein
MKEYRIVSVNGKLTSKGILSSLDELEVAINEYAKDGWEVKTMSSPDYADITNRAEYIVIMEREL